MSSSFKSPVDTAKAISGTAGAKNSANIVNVILLSFLAGAYIAFGGLLINMPCDHTLQEFVYKVGIAELCKISHSPFHIFPHKLNDFYSARSFPHKIGNVDNRA